jgi:ligand-binding sensor protein
VNEPQRLEKWSIVAAVDWFGRFSMNHYRLSKLLDLSAVQRMADANYKASDMPVGIIDAFDGSILVGVGWQDICVKFHRANQKSLERCQASDNYIKDHLVQGEACRYKCKNGLWDIGIPIVVAEKHLATMFLGQFFYEGEILDREFFKQQAVTFGYDLDANLAALDQVPVFKRERGYSTRASILFKSLFQCTIWPSRSGRCWIQPRPDGKPWPVTPSPTFL